MQPWNASTLPRPGRTRVCEGEGAFKLLEIALAKASLEKLRGRQRKGLSQVHTELLLASQTE